MEDKIGRSLDAIHSEGHGVVGWKDKLKNSMERFFIRLKVDKPVERNNVSSQAGESSTAMLTRHPCASRSVHVSDVRFATMGRFKRT